MSQPILQQVESQNKQGGIEGVVRFVCCGSNEPRPRPRCGLTYHPQLVLVLRHIRTLLLGNGRMTDQPSPILARPLHPSA